MLETILLIGLVVIIFLLAFMLLRTLTFARSPQPVEAAPQIELDEASVAAHLSEAIRCQTVSVVEETPGCYEPFEQLERTLRGAYPRVHAQLEQRVINGHSLLYCWPGSQPELAPLVLLAHQDVVPADPSTLDKWEHPPFEGVIADGFVWGRGTLDIKNQLIATLEAVEYLLKAGFQPERSIYLAFGHDEEYTGINGQAKIVEWFKAREIRPLLVLDEGGSIVQDVLPGVKEPVALVGYAEKGFLTLKLTVECPPGHSATPPKQTAIGILARGLAFLDESPRPAKLRFIRRMFNGMGSVLPFGMQLIFANTWLLGPLARRVLEARSNTNATLRTTTAITMINGGVRENVLPAQATAKVNFRLMPGDSIAKVCEHVRKSLEDKRIQFEPFGPAWEATPVSSTDTDTYRLLDETIRQVFDNLPVAPYLVLGATDARYYSEVSDQVFRLSPVQLDSGDLGRMHGINERISIEGLGKMVRFYVQLIKNMG